MATLGIKLVLLICVSYFLTTEEVSAAYCSGQPNPRARQNVNPIFHGEPIFIRQVKNGKLYSVGVGDDAFFIVHVWGSPYEMGYAHGALMKDKAYQFINSVWSYMENEIMQAITHNKSTIFKDWFLRDVANVGLVVALDYETVVTSVHTPDYFLKEMQGLADATGLDYWKIYRIHMLGELTKGDCSMLGAWGNSVKTPGSFLQLRALDWNTDGPFKDFPQVTVYHPSWPRGHAFANIGWTGWLGSITGFNSKRLSISEIGVSFPDNTFGYESRIGVPFTFLLRDILQYGDSVPKAEKMIRSAKRTCNLILGIGHAWASSPDEMFRAVEYSAANARFFTDSNMEPEATWHPRIKNVVYYGMDWLCPSYNQVLSKQLKTHYGELSADVVIRDVVSIEQSGSLHIAVYDLNNDFVYIANAKASYEIGPLYAYDRPFIRVNATALFGVTKPVV